MCLTQCTFFLTCCLFNVRTFFFKVFSRFLSDILTPNIVGSVQSNPQTQSCGLWNRLIGLGGSGSAILNVALKQWWWFYFHWFSSHVWTLLCGNVQIKSRFRIKLGPDGVIATSEQFVATPPGGSVALRVSQLHAAPSALAIKSLRTQKEAQHSVSPHDCCDHVKQTSLNIDRINRWRN